MAPPRSQNPTKPMKVIKDLMPYVHKLNALYRAKEADDKLKAILNAKTLEEAIAPLREDFPQAS